MTGPTFRIEAPSRLHFGLLAWGPDAPRQFGSVGLMIDHPGLAIRATVAPTDSAEGPLAPRARNVLDQIGSRLRAEGRAVPALRLTIDRAPPEHVGLGTGSALSLAVARLVLAHLGESDPPVARLVALTGRGLRSGIGLHGSGLGGLIVDGGRSPTSPFPPLLARLDWPDDWSILVVTPSIPVGLAGQRESDAFATLPGPSSRTIDRLCRLVLLGLLPAVADRDLPAFGQALTEIQAEVGHAFAPAQGGPFAHPDLARIAGTMRDLGLVGVGQSSWGPTLYGVTDASTELRSATLARLATLDLLDPNRCRWTESCPTGTRLCRDP